MNYKDVLILEDGSDDGDGYDFSPLEDDFIITSKNVKAEIDIKTYKNINKATISYNMHLPKDFKNRKQKILDGWMKVSFESILKENSPVLEIKMNIENDVKDHRVRLLIPNHKKQSTLTVIINLV